MLWGKQEAILICAISQQFWGKAKINYLSVDQQNSTVALCKSSTIEQGLSVNPDVFPSNMKDHIDLEVKFQQEDHTTPFLYSPLFQTALRKQSSPYTILQMF